jgi:hypothetical protein
VIHRLPFVLALASTGCIETLPLPEDFPAERAAEAASLSVSAYDMHEYLDANRFGTWEPPAGYTLHSTHTTEQNWNDLTTADPQEVPVGWIGTDGDGVVHVVFRGTTTSTELLLDLAIEQVDFPFGVGDWGGTHRGFTERWQELFPTVTDALSQLVIDGAQGIAFSGHSLGGAVSTLAAATYAEQFDLPIELITFGSPRVGDSDFVEVFEGLGIDSWRVTNPRDVVPGVPEDAPAGSQGTGADQLFYTHVPTRSDLPFDDEGGAVERNLGVGGNHASCRYLQETCELSAEEADCLERVAEHPSCAD